MTTTRRRIRWVAPLGTLALALGLLTGCSDTPPDEASADPHAGHSTAPATDSATDSATDATEATAEHNAADEMFVGMMVVHHEQALVLTEMVAEREVSDELASLAHDMNHAQGDEIALMQSWLNAWGSTTDHSGMAMPGLLTDEQLSDVDALVGAEFEQAWMKAMIEHHEGAITMADDELADGVNEEARALAERITTAQTNEIDTMRQMLAG